MEKEEFEGRKTKLFDFLEKAGIDRKEVEKFITKELTTKKSFGMSEGDAMTSSIISTVNYYRKQLDKLDKRVKFLCLGITNPTDYGLKKHVMEIKKKVRDIDLSPSERESMVDKGIINEMGMPLHTADTTLFEERIGSPINLDDEMTQQLIGIIENADGKRFPCIVRVNGKKACDEEKYQHVWCLISGEQGKSTKHPNYIILNSRELLMKPVKDAARITASEYQTMVETHFKDLVKDMHIEEDVKALGEKSDTFFLKHSRMTGYTMTTYGTNTTIITARSAMLDVVDSTIADARIPTKILEINVDPDTGDEIWLCVQTRTKKPQDLGLKLDILGMYTERPVDRNKLKMNDKFMLSEDEEKNSSLGDEPVYAAATKGGSVEGDKFFQEINKMGR